ncbi:MAG: hypothetical protein HC942_21470 [Microcoleus sp. SU_5_6]|nr:hypothetical protein [Microcoleus sp. SU_5_6]NJS12649.1 hypothetical protein [Microcoleus sp. CSU_2_2]
MWGNLRSLLHSYRVTTTATSFIRSQIAYDSIQGNRVKMGASTRIALAGMPASQKQSANCLANYAAAVHPADIRRKQSRSQGPRCLRTILRL